MKCFMFPGQGSQHVGMGETLFNKYQNYVEIASEILKLNLTIFKRI